MIEQIEKIFSQLGDLSPAVFATLILFGINLLMRRIPKFPNWPIPFLSVLFGMMLFPVFMPITTHFENPLGRNIGLGFLTGLAASLGYGTILRFAEKRWPWLHDVINGNGHDKAEPPDSTPPPATPAPPPNL